MKSILIFSSLVAAALACTNCGPPQDPITPCGVPDCSIPENRQNNALFPHPDPNYFWQCFPTPDGWVAIERQCACGTVFNPFLSVRRCSFWFEEGWTAICGWPSPPELRPCDPWCPDCGTTNGGGTTTTGGDTTLSVTVTVPIDDDTTPTTDDGCVCPTPPCTPCVWWPCVPCIPPPCFCNQRG